MTLNELKIIAKENNVNFASLKDHVSGQISAHGTNWSVVDVGFVGDEADKGCVMVERGYRKNTTDEYVPNAYRANFGWKNTYYQHARLAINVFAPDFV